MLQYYHQQHKHQYLEIDTYDVRHWQLLALSPLTLISLPLLAYVTDDLFQTGFSSLLWIPNFRNCISPTWIVLVQFQQRGGYSLVDLITALGSQLL